MSFPLYDTLKKNLPKKDLTVVQKKAFIKGIEDISTVSDEGSELIYALIKYYYIEHNKEEKFTVPYSASISKDKVTFNLLDFPLELRQLLYKFILLHSKKLEEDRGRPVTEDPILPL